MINLSINDATQKAIILHLQTTEELISGAIATETGTYGDAEITAMSDLGLAGNLMRMHGGFYTGMYAQWHSSIPFVPVDATINSCGVYVFTLREVINQNTFINLVAEAKKKIKLLGYSWNFERGNHFITIGTLDNGRPCVVMHASADEYKKSNPNCALYPTETSWYYDDIRVFQSQKNVSRYLRYIVGTVAEKFIEIAFSIEDINRKRLSETAQLIFGELIDEEIMFVSHYGMPSDSSVAIGCSWKKTKFALLTAPNKDIYIAEPVSICGNSEETLRPTLYPHGFGVEIDHPTITYSNDRLTINGTNIEADETIASLPTKKIRMIDMPQFKVEAFARHILEKRDCKIIHCITPAMSLNNIGII